MKLSDISEEFWSVLFGVQRSVRYHDRRVRFYDSMHKTTAALSLVFGSATIAGLLSSIPYGRDAALAFAAVITILAAFDLVMGFSAKARQHSELKRRFVTLEADMMARTGDEHLPEHQVARLKIEADEPPIMRALDLLCHNELVRAHGIDDVKPVPFYKRCTANVFAWQ